jgi:hypothetical protein
VDEVKSFKPQIVDKVFHSMSDILYQAGYFLSGTQKFKHFLLELACQSRKSFAIKLSS